MQCRKAFLIAMCILVWTATAQAWNKPGHMTSAAIAYADLRDHNPNVRSQISRLLREHPYFHTEWMHKLARVPEEESDLYLFMLAARWPDDARGDANFDHPRWHYINIPFRPGQTGMSIPGGETILTAFPQNHAIITSAAADNEARAVALCWMLHLIGDIHQPLHTIKLVTEQFPEPEGDRGGTRFYIRVTAANRLISLHKLWDGLILGSDNFRAVRNKATALRNKAGMKRGDFAHQLQVKPFDEWAKETYAIAVTDASRNGTLQGGSDKSDGPVLPSGYLDSAKQIAERQIVLSGYRIADVMVEVFGK
jgi:hypothetical protein